MRHQLPLILLILQKNQDTLSDQSVCRYVCTYVCVCVCVCMYVRTYLHCMYICMDVLGLGKGSIANADKSNIDKNMCEPLFIFVDEATKIVFQPLSQP